MVTRNLGKVQEALYALNPTQRNINELVYFKSKLESPNHSGALCSAVNSAINKLNQQHSAVVNALIQYGTSYESLDESFAKLNNHNYQSTSVCHDFRYISAPAHEKTFWEKTWNQIIQGDFSDDATWLGGTISIGAAFWGVDAPMDIRDFSADVIKGEWGWAAVSLVSLLPVVGILGKGGKTIVKGAKAVDAESTIIKQGSHIIDSTYKNGVLEGIEKLDYIAIQFRQNDKQLWQTNKFRKYVLSEDSFTIFSRSNTIDRIIGGVKYLPNFKYSKKSPEDLTMFRKAFDGGLKADFLKKIATENSYELKQLNLNQIDIEDMKNGKEPIGFEVHHKLSLDDGGDNSFSNLILIGDEYHDVFTSYQNTFTKTNAFKNDGYAIVDWVIPTGQVYVPDHLSLPVFEW